MHHPIIIFLGKPFISPFYTPYTHTKKKKATEKNFPKPKILANQNFNVWSQAMKPKSYLKTEEKNRQRKRNAAQLKSNKYSGISGVLLGRQKKPTLTKYKCGTFLSLPKFSRQPNWQISTNKCEIFKETEKRKSEYPPLKTWKRKQVESHFCALNSEIV